MRLVKRHKRGGEDQARRRRRKRDEEKTKRGGNQLTEDERFTGSEIQRKLPSRPVGAFHEKKAKNKKVNLGNKAKFLREMKYKKPIKKGAKRK